MEGLEQNKNYVIVKFSASRYGRKDRLNSGNMVLIMNKEKYIPDKNVCYNFSTLGVCYKKQYLGSDAKNYILAYSVDEVNLKRSYLSYTESYDSVYKVKLNLEKYEG